MPTTEQRAAIQAAIKKINAKAYKYDKYNNYYNGKHSLNFASEKFKSAYAAQVNKFCDNLCKIVVNAPCDRLEITSFSNEDDKTLYEKTWEIWKYSKMPRLARLIHQQAFKTSDAYAVVWLDDKRRARIYPQDPENCAVWIDPETGTAERGAKFWRGNDGYFYLTLYYPDRIEKYITRQKVSFGNIPSSSASFVERQVAGEAFPLPNPTGVCPLFHFGLEYSILDDVMPLNDALNKSCADLLISSESNSMRQRWTTGISYLTDDETGKPIIPFEGARQWHTTAKPNTEASFGEFSDVALKDFLDTINDFRLEIANVSGIPHYYFTLSKGDFPSGEALTKAESRFTALVTNAQRDFGETWADIISFCLQLEGNPKDEKQIIETAWLPAAPTSLSEQLDNSIKKTEIGVSNEQVQSEIGYTKADIERMAAEKAASTAAAGDAFGKMFDAGTTAAKE